MRAVDLLPRDLEIVLSILKREVPGFEVRAAGSRAKRNARRHSDLDLIVMSERPLDVKVRARLSAAFSESDLPFSVDVLDWAALDERFRRLVSQGSVIIQKKTD